MDSKGVTATAPVDETLPWGVYIPPTSSPKAISEDEEHKRFDMNVVDMNNILKEKHEGYVRIMDKRGKMFQCGFSRSVRYVVEVMSVRKRSNDAISTDMISPCENPIKVDASVVAETDHPSSEECLHPEEALFLHMRGLLRIESLPAEKTICPEQSTHATMSTQELFEKMLPECNVSISVYLAYAHLREQGYILMRYTKNRASLLREMNATVRRQPGGDSLASNLLLTSAHMSTDIEAKTLNSDEELDDLVNHKSSGIKHKAEELSLSHEGYNDFSTTSGFHRSRRKELKQNFIIDVASAPPPCIPCHASNSQELGMTPLYLSYLAYNPNAHFKRTNPGFPDFGVVILPYHSHGSHGPTFHTISSLVSLCQLRGNDLTNMDDTDCAGFPLRIMTVSDAGAVVAFGVTGGDVPIINH